MDTITTMFAIDCAASGLALVSIGATIRCVFVNHKLRVERDEAIAALRNEETEGAHWRELADDALANIEDLQAKLAEERAAANRWAAKYAVASSDLRRIHAEKDAESARRAAHMRSIAVLGNRSPKRRKQTAVA